MNGSEPLLKPSECVILFVDQIRDVLYFQTTGIFPS